MLLLYIVQYSLCVGSMAGCYYLGFRVHHNWHWQRLSLHVSHSVMFRSYRSPWPVVTSVRLTAGKPCTDTNDQCPDFSHYNTDTVETRPAYLHNLYISSNTPLDHIHDILYYRKISLTFRTAYLNFFKISHWPTLLVCFQLDNLHVKISLSKIL